MIELSDRVRAVRDLSREAAVDLRSRALAIDTDPDAMDEHYGSPVFEMVRQADTPPQYRESLPSTPLLRAMERGSCLENVAGLIELARGDVGAILACPSPGLAGVFVELLGTPEQQEWFFTRMHGGRRWSFFAMTEESRGNDATAMETRFDRDGEGWRLNGGKCYVGNAARGSVGVVFGRTGRGALSIRAALVEVPAPGWHGEKLDMIGLRGAYISRLSFSDVEVPAGRMLGDHLPVTRRGIFAAITTFNHMRVRIAASAVGTALAMVEYVLDHRKNAPGGQLALARAEAGRELVYEAAARIDRDPERGYLSSAAKLGAIGLAVGTAHWASAALGPAGLIEHPLLEKWTRDVHAFEFMEGTSNIHRLHVARGYQAGDADA
ncbi:acyl-CoA dehydrogenase family protein [Amycolatopsis sp. cmx-4-68]|uniref:acyl-CoA dehydrogenase family protein n=1 Tax=Amycolatopsis sp. cmx-4-68 TaxID=2790938 RepID=UPI00397C7044